MEQINCSSGRRVTTTYSYNVSGHRTSKSTGADQLVYVLDPLSPYGEVLETYQNGRRADSVVYGEDRLGIVNEQDQFYSYALTIWAVCLSFAIQTELPGKLYV